MRSLLLPILAALSLQAQPQVQTFVLPNGLRVVHLEDHEHPQVRVRLQLRLDPADTPPGLQGLPLLALRMLKHSDAGELKAEDFDRLLEGSGIQLTQTLTTDGLEWQFSARSRDQDRALGLLADRLLRTIFDPSTLEIQRLACWRDELRGDASPRLRLRRTLASKPGTRPTLASLGAITLADLIAFKARVFRPDRAVLGIHGDLGLEQAKRLVLLSLGTWTAQASVPPYGAGHVPGPALLDEPVRISAPGTGLRIQAVIPPPQELQLETAALLGLLIPGEAALAPVQITLEDSVLVATLDAAAPTTDPLALLQERLQTLRQRGFTQAELDRARSAWLARRSLDVLHPEALLAAALAEARNRRIALDRMRALSLETLNAGLHLWLDPKSIRVGAAGDPELLKVVPKP